MRSIVGAGRFWSRRWSSRTSRSASSCSFGLLFRLLWKLSEQSAASNFPLARIRYQIVRKMSWRRLKRGRTPAHSAPSGAPARLGNCNDRRWKIPATCAFPNRSSDIIKLDFHRFHRSPVLGKLHNSSRHNSENSVLCVSVKWRDSGESFLFLLQHVRCCFSVGVCRRRRTPWRPPWSTERSKLTTPD